MQGLMILVSAMALIGASARSTNTALAFTAWMERIADVSVSFDYAADKGMFVVSKQQISKDQQWLRVPLSHVVCTATLTEISKAKKSSANSIKKTAGAEDQLRLDYESYKRLSSDGLPIPAAAAAKMLDISDENDRIAVALLFIRHYIVLYDYTAYAALIQHNSNNQGVPTNASWAPYMAALPEFVSSVGYLDASFAQRVFPDIRLQHLVQDWQEDLLKRHNKLSAVLQALFPDAEDNRLVTERLATIYANSHTTPSNQNNESAVDESAVDNSTDAVVDDQGGVASSLELWGALDCTTSFSACSPLSLTAFLWAHTLVSSRALTLSGKRYLVPGADMVNHGSVISSESYEKFHRVDENAKSFIILSDREHQAKQEVLEHYGDNGNRRLSLWHGFIVPGADSDCVELSSSACVAIPTEETLMKACEVQAATTGAHAAVLHGFDVSALSTLCGKDGQDIVECFRNPLGNAHVRAAIQQRIEQLNHSASLSALISTTNLAAAPINVLSHLRDEHRKALETLLQDEFTCKSTGDNASPTDKTAADTQQLSLLEWVKRATVGLGIEDAVTLPFEIRETPGKGRGLFATQNISAEEVYLTLPTAVVMDSKAALSSLVGCLLRELNEKYSQGDDFHALLFFLLTEKAFGQTSAYHSYIASLPSVADLRQHVPLLRQFKCKRKDADCAEQELQQLSNALRGSAIHDDLMQYIRNTKQRFRRIVQNVIDRYPVFFNATPSLRRTFRSFDEYAWATAIIDSRSIWWGGLRHLVPVLDMINCWSGDSRRRPHATKPAAVRGVEVAVTRAAADIAAGDEVFEEYGQPNHVYYQFHGFVFWPNFHDCLQLNFKLTQAMQAKKSVAKILLNGFGQVDASTFNICVDAPHNYDDVSEWRKSASVSSVYQLLQAIGAGDFKDHIRRQSTRYALSEYDAARHVVELSGDKDARDALYDIALATLQSGEKTAESSSTKIKNIALADARFILSEHLLMKQLQQAAASLKK